MSIEVQLERGQLVSVRRSSEVGLNQPSQLALVLSPLDFHLSTHGVFLALVTTELTTYRFAVALPEGFSGMTVLADRVRRLSLDRYQIQVLETIPPRIVNQVLGKIDAVLRV